MVDGGLLAVVLGEAGLEDQFDIAPGAEHQIGIGHKLADGAGRIAAPGFPQLRTIIAVEGNLHALLARGLHGGQRGLGRGGAQRGGYARNVQPFGAVEQGGPVGIAEVRQGEGGAGAVIEDIRRAVDGARRQEIEAHAAGAGGDGRDVDAPAPQFLERGQAQFIFRHDGDHFGRMAEPLQAQRHIGLGAADEGLQVRQGGQGINPGRGQADKQFSEADDGRGHRRHSPFSERF